MRVWFQSIPVLLQCVLMSSESLIRLLCVHIIMPFIINVYFNVLRVSDSPAVC